MAYIVYCIMKDPVVNGAPITGVKGKEVSFVAGHDLCAAVSEMPAMEGAPPVPDLLAYGKVVEDLHRLKAVVPMRYGCFLDGIPDIQRIMGERRRQYHALLEELEGHVEMGIRILLAEQAAKPQQEEQTANGRDYLRRRKAQYRMKDEAAQHHQMHVDRYIEAFSGLYGKHRTETASRSGSVVLSVYFLVPGGAVNLFRECFQRVAENEKFKTLISGPWPPYNFVAPEFVPAKESGLARDR